MLTHKRKVILSITGVATTLVTIMLMTLSPITATVLSPVLATLIGAGAVATGLLALEEYQK